MIVLIQQFVFVFEAQVLLKRLKFLRRTPED
jgi:hypothetical protein